MNAHTVDGLSVNDCSLSAQPRNAYDNIPATVIKPTITFQAAITRALGRYREITKPATKMPSAEKLSATVPRIML